MAIESMVALGLATAILYGLACYASEHRSEDADKHHHPSDKNMPGKQASAER
jgi:hypothetical protein